MASAAPGAAPSGQLSGGRMWMAGILLALSNFMIILDTSIANVSLPHIAGSLAISPDEGTWVITSYSVADAICVPLTGWLAARFGMVRTYLLAMIGFGIFSILCGMSVSLSMLVACRIGQGFCGGPVMPLTQTLLLRVFPPQKRGQAMGLWAMTTVVAPIGGPLLGGTISDNWSWHWIFFINIPIAILCVGGSFLMIRQFETDPVRQRIDRVGLALLVIWVGALQVMLDLGRDRDWFGSSLIVGLAAVAAVGFIAFLIWELTDEQPVVDLRVFRHRGFAAACVALFLTYATFFSSVVVTPQWLQGAMGYTASWSGYVTAWQGFFAVIMSQVVGRFVGRIDARVIASTGIAWMGFAIFLRSHWTSGVDYWTLVIPHLLTGFGLPMFFVPITIISLGAVLPEETASAAGLYSFLRTLSGAIGTSIATTAWANGAQRARADLTNIIHPPAGLADRLAAQGFRPDQVRGLLEQLVMKESYALSLDHLFQIAAVVMLFAAMLIWLAPRPGRPMDASAAH